MKRKRRAKIGGRFAIGLFLLAWIAYFAVAFFDHAVANITWTVFLILAVIFGYIWLWYEKSVPRFVRIGLVVLPAIGLAAFFSWFEFYGFSGELVPQFRLRRSKNFSSSVSARPENPKKQTDVTMDFSFRQFLGNSRTGLIQNIQLLENWDSQPPKILWKQPTGPGWSGFAIQEGLCVTMEEFEGQDSIVALDLADGSLRWRTPLGGKHFHPLGGGGPSATPTIEGDRVYTQSSTGIVGCCELLTGKLIWKVDLLKKAGIRQAEAEAGVSWGRSGSPLIYEDFVVVPFGGESGKRLDSLIALGRSTGEERWRGGTEQISYASPSLMTLQGVEQIVMVNESSVTGHEPATGAVLWSYDWPGQSNGGPNVSQPVSINQSMVLLSSGYGKGALMLDFSNSTRSTFVVTPKWKNTTLLKSKFTNAILFEGYLYALSDGILECVRAEDGKRMWKDGKNGRLGHGQILVVGKHLLISTEDGRCVLGRADPDAFHKVGEFPVLSGITWNTIAIVGNRILMRNGEQSACIEVPIAP